MLRWPDSLSYAEVCLARSREIKHRQAANGFDVDAAVRTPKSLMVSGEMIYPAQQQAAFYQQVPNFYARLWS